MRQHVILLHGLWFNRTVMALLARRIRKSGFQTYCLSYPSMKESPSGNARYLHHSLQSLLLHQPEAKEQPVHFVAHSLGGLVVLNFLNQFPEFPVGRVVLLGSPVLGSNSARRLSNLSFGNRLLGRSIEQNGLLDGVSFKQDQMNGGEQERMHAIGMIAGTLAFGLGTLLGSGGHQKEPGDGVVSVSETRMPGLADHICVRVAHSGLLVSRQVAEQTSVFLKTGNFQHD
ncbi:MAG: alpha/beta hydrolase [Gammaproteobacteria bacterium]|nr:alpha/beta hydrolase [Gammaproteobacteria bacterium]